MDDHLIGVYQHTAGNKHALVFDAGKTFSISTFNVITGEFERIKKSSVSGIITCNWFRNSTLVVEHLDFEEKAWVLHVLHHTTQFITKQLVPVPDHLWTAVATAYVVRKMEAK